MPETVLSLSLSDWQYPLAFALDFSRWMCRHSELYRLQANMNLSELTITGEQITKGARVLVSEPPSFLGLVWDGQEISLTHLLPVSDFMHQSCLEQQLSFSTFR